MAEAAGFEPAGPCGPPAFEAGAINRTLPRFHEWWGWMDLNHRRPFGHLIYSQASLTTRTTPPKKLVQSMVWIVSKPGGLQNKVPQIMRHDYVADQAGLEPATLRLTVERSDQLSYWSKLKGGTLVHLEDGHTR